MTKPYSVTAEQIAQEIDTDLVRGLTSDEASLRYAKNGPNSLGEEKKTPLWKRFLQQFADAFPFKARHIAASVLPGGKGADRCPVCPDVNNTVHLAGQADYLGIRMSAKHFIQLCAYRLCNQKRILQALPFSPFRQEAVVGNRRTFLNGQILPGSKNRADCRRPDIKPDGFNHR